MRVSRRNLLKGLAFGSGSMDAHKASVDNDGSMNALVLSLLSSDSFMYRSKPISLTQIEP